MEPISYFKNITGNCPYLNKTISINVEYDVLKFLGNMKKNHFVRTDCKYYNNCEFYKKCPLIKQALNSV